MRTEKVGTETITTLDPADHLKIARLLEGSDGRVALPQLGRFKVMTNDDIWLALVTQVCVMGSARGMEVISGNRAMRQEFVEALRPALTRAEGRLPDLLAGVLSKFKATRFPTKNAKVLCEILASPTVYDGSRFVLFDGLETGGAPSETRRLIRKRVRWFNLKSASDFMITNGLSDDVIALDTRVVGALGRHFGYGTPVKIVRSKSEVYLSVETELRSACQKLGRPLALLDRAIFQLAGKSALDFVLAEPPA